MNLPKDRSRTKPERLKISMSMARSMLNKNTLNSRTKDQKNTTRLKIMSMKRFKILRKQPKEQNKEQKI